MKKTVSLHEFRDDFHAIRPNNFTYEGLEALYDFLEEMENDTGEELELDVIALCCDFSEYGSLDELKADYSDYDTIEDFEERTFVIPVSTGGYIIQAF